MRRGRQSGSVLALVLAIVIMLLVGAAATYALSRLGTAREDTGQIGARLAAAVDALDQYAGTAQRLPCPANPAVDDGVEVQATASTCSFPEGTIPWRTIGLRRDDAFDPWGRKISYRVYTGNKGSFTQPGGISMVECDTVEPTSGAVAASGLCIANANPQLRNSSEARFLLGKGLAVNDNGTARSAAYVLVSHGATGLGGYTASGVQLMPLPVGDERNNLNATGGFTVKAFSDVETTATVGTHFDDFVAYRTVTDLVKRVGLQARDWPEADPTVTTSLTFDAASIFAATGTTPTSGVALANAIDFGNAQVTGHSGVATTPGLTYEASTAGGGLAVGGGIFTGGAAFLNNLLTNYGDEYLDIKLASTGRKFAITLNDVGLTAYGVYFKAQLRFYKDAADGTTTLVRTVDKLRCFNSSHLASYTIDVAADFNRVEVHPVDSAFYAALSAFVVSEIKACTAAATACRTNLAIAATPANATDCP